MPGALRLALQDAPDEIVLALTGRRLELELTADGLEFGDRHLVELGVVEVVALASGLDLGELLVIGDRDADMAAGRAAAAPIAGSGVALVGCGHMNRSHLRQRKRWVLARNMGSRRKPGDGGSMARSRALVNSPMWLCPCVRRPYGGPRAAPSIHR